MTIKPGKANACRMSIVCFKQLTKNTITEHSIHWNQELFKGTMSNFLFARSRAQKFQTFS